MAMIRVCLLPACTNAANQPRSISIVWPRQGDAFSFNTCIKIKAEVSDVNGSVIQVRFFANTNLIGIATNSPFNALWNVMPREAPYGTWMLKAVVVDSLGATNESAPVTISYYTGGPPDPVVEIVSPRDGALFAEPATFVISAEVLASVGDTGPVEYFVGTNSVSIFDQVTNLSATTPPSSIMVSNLAEGEYSLAVRYLGMNGCPSCPLHPTRSIRVVKIGVQLPSVTPNGRMQFEVVTSFPDRPTIIEASPNLHDWSPISTNRPSGNAFIFTDSSPGSDARRFYRVRVLPE